jgi:hypothetical protein
MIILREAASHPVATMSTMADITRGREPRLSLDQEAS